VLSARPCRRNGHPTFDSRGDALDVSDELRVQGHIRPLAPEMGLGGCLDLGNCTIMESANTTARVDGLPYTLRHVGGRAFGLWVLVCHGVFSGVHRRGPVSAIPHTSRHGPLRSDRYCSDRAESSGFVALTGAAEIEYN